MEAAWWLSSLSVLEFPLPSASFFPFPFCFAVAVDVGGLDVVDDGASCFLK